MRPAASASGIGSARCRTGSTSRRSARMGSYGARRSCGSPVPLIIGAITGLWIGILRLRVRRPYARGRMTPYRGWMKWHHVGGLIGGVFLDDMDCERMAVGQLLCAGLRTQHRFLTRSVWPPPAGPKASRCSRVGGDQGGGWRGYDRNLFRNDRRRAANDCSQQVQCCDDGSAIGHSRIGNRRCTDLSGAARLSG